MRRLERLKELQEKPNMNADETGEYLRLIRVLVPGMIRVCEAYVAVKTTYDGVLLSIVGQRIISPHEWEEMIKTSEARLEALLG